MGTFSALSRILMAITACLMLCAQGEVSAAAQETVVMYAQAGPPIVREDFENCQPRDKVKLDERVNGCWTIRQKDWGSKLLMGSPGAPDLTYDPKLTGLYDVYVESRATHFPVAFGLKFTSDRDFTEIVVPNKGATEKQHFSVEILVKKAVRMDGVQIAIRDTGKPVYLDAFRFVPVSRKECKRLALEQKSDFVICKEKGRHFAFPGVAQAANGDILVVARDGRTHVSPGDYGKIALIRSRDHGLTWDPRTTALEKVNTDLRDPSILRMKDGTILLTCTAGTMRSTDNGRSWDAPRPAPVFTPHGPVEDLEGNLVYVGITGHHGATWIEAHRSTDKGKTWQFLGKMIVMEPDYDKCAKQHLPYYDEPHVLISRNQWLALYRMDTVDDFMTQTVSHNNGRDWSWPVKTPLYGHPPHLLRLKSGAILCTYGYRHEPYGIRASLTYDEGHNWQEAILRDDGRHGDLGYPVSIELDDGRIMSVYYFNQKTGDNDIHVAGTMYRIK